MGLFKQHLRYTNYDERVKTISTNVPKVNVAIRDQRPVYFALPSCAPHELRDISVVVSAGCP
jgi:hypothetical protein